MYVMWIILVSLAAYTIRVIMGPSIWDRLLGMNLISTKIIIFIAVFASYSEMAYLLDYAIIYALSGFIGVIFIAFFFEQQRRKKK